MMARITTWTRLEPETRNRHLIGGASAPIADPLWLLGRQWQVGEFEGEDAGSPVDVRVSTRSEPLSRYHPGLPAPDGTSEGHPYDPAVDPLEPLVERERVRPAAPDADGRDRQRAVTAGTRFLRTLAAHGFAGYTAGDFDASLRLARPDDPEPSAPREAAGHRFARVAGRRTLDGDALHGAFVDADSADGYDFAAVPLPEALRDELTDDAATARLTTAVDAFRDWYTTQFDQPTDDVEGAWDDERLEYAFAVGTRTRFEETVLESEAYAGGRLDWPAFDVSDGTLGTPADDTQPEEETRTAVPTRTTFRGAPRPRWWELEDGDVDLARLTPAPEDLARLLLSEFALTAGDDWYSVPLTVPVGSLLSVSDLVVTDSYGRERSPTPVTDPDWGLFGLTGDTADRLFVPPTLVDALEADPVESVSFGRDEVANVAWAVERRVADGVGDAFERDTPPATDEATTAAAIPDADAGEAVSYRLATTVPDYWYPLLPEWGVDGVRLRRGRLVDIGEGRGGDPLGRVLDVDPLVLPEEEVPHVGATVDRSFQTARWSDGSTHVWVGRQVTPDRPVGASGLAYDALSGIGDDAPE